MWNIVCPHGYSLITHAQIYLREDSELVAYSLGVVLQMLHVRPDTEMPSSVMHIQKQLTDINSILECI